MMTKKTLSVAFLVLVTTSHSIATKRVTDICSFEFSKDNNVNLGGVVLGGIDAASFETTDSEETVRRSTFIKDKNGIYYLKILKPWIKPCHKPEIEFHKQILVKDPDSFQIMGFFPDQYAKDKYYVYSMSVPVWNAEQQLDIFSNSEDYNFDKLQPLKLVSKIQIEKIATEEVTILRRILNKADIRHIYNKYPKEKFNIDIVYSDSWYKDDGYRIFYNLSEIKEANRDSFYPISFILAHDKNYVYKNGKVLFKKNGIFQLMKNPRFAKDRLQTVDLYSGEIVKNIQK